MTLIAQRIEELRGESARLLQEARSVKDAADNESRSLTGEERTKIQNLLDASDQKLQDAKLEERLAGLDTPPPEERGNRLPEAAEERSDNPPATDDPEEREERAALLKTNTPEYVRAFYRYARYGEEGISPEDERFLREARAEIRALTEGVDAEGGYLAPAQLLAGIEREALDMEQLIPRCLVINSNARAIQQLKGVDTIQFGWVQELAQKPEDMPTFGRVTIEAHTGAVIVRVSDELLEDAAFDLSGYLQTLAAEGKIETEEAAVAAGSGSGQPFGVLTRINGEAGTPNRFTTATSGTLAADDFINALYDLLPRYRRNATWVLGTQAILAARLLKAGDQYIWQPGLQLGQPDNILGRPVVEAVHEDLNNAVAAGNDIGFVGDMRRYTVLRRIALQMKRLEELYAETDEVGFRFRFRTGGDVQRTAAFRSIRVAT